MRPCFKAMLLLLAVLFPLDCFSGPEPEMTLSIGGDVKKPGQWSVEQLKTQFADQIQNVLLCVHNLSLFQPGGLC